MAITIDERQTVQLFCRAWFQERNLEKTLSFLAEDIKFVGTGMGETAQGKKMMMEYLRQDINEIQEPFHMDFSVIHEQYLAAGIFSQAADLTLINSMYMWHLRFFFTLKCTGGKWQVVCFHAAEPGSSQQGGEHYPQTLVVENVMKQRNDLLNESIAGGMMGGYIEPGFPFYFINRRMLEYLGYGNEAEFVEDIGGLITNCMHPDDRKRIDEEVEQQLACKGEYVVEYRMKRKDGSYIWVHDIGRQMTDEDGRPAITSVCIDITVRKKAQDEVMHIYNNVPGAVFRCRYDACFSILDANDGFFEFLNYTRKEFEDMGNRFFSVIHPEDVDALRGKLGAGLADGNTINNDNRVICKGGEVKWVSLKAQMLKEETGEQYFYCVFVDITEEKQLQSRVRELYEKELEYFAELSSSEGSTQGRFNITKNVLENYMTDPNAAISHVGATYQETIFNLAASAVEVSDREQILSVLDREKVLEDYSAGNVDYRFEYLRRRSDKSLFWASTNFRSYLNPETGDVIVFFYTFDITEQKLKEQLLHKIASLDYDVIVEIDIKKDIFRGLTFASSGLGPAWQELHFQEKIRRTAESFMNEAAAQEYLKQLDYDYMQDMLGQQEAYTFSLEMCDEDGSIRTKRFQVFYINKELGRVCLARTDVTDVVQKEQKQKEELAAALVAAEQANAAKSDFLSRMSHEIRTPMNAIIGMSAIAAQSIGDDEQVEDCISKIGISSRFLLSLINDILDMSRIESGKMLLKNEKIPTEEFMNGVNSICYGQAAAKNVEYECIVDPVLDDYYIGDAMKLQQVLINILSNAIKFTGEGGRVTFSGEQRQRTKNDVVLRFIVNDTGVGMSEEFLPHIFEPFSQESTGTTALYGGTGLGLAISKNIVDMMDGRITVRSIKEIGTEFMVDVKLGISEEEKQRHNQRKQDYNFSHLKTLVVDDDVAVCEGAVATLKEIGIKAEWVDSGRKAVDRVEILWAEGRYYDMILIDWKMPGMDGIETARRIRRIVGPEVTIIIMTSYDWIAIEHEAKLAGVNLLMSKPMFKSSLVSAFTKALGKKEEEARQTEEVDYDFAGKRVLLVEDNAINTEVAVMLLESRNFAVDTAENGLRALEKFSKSEEGYYNAILMDIRMPLMDGLTAATNIRHLSNKDAKYVPIIAMTANAFDDDIEKSKAAGMNAHLAKPIEPKRLYQILYDFIQERENAQDSQNGE